MKLAIVLVLCVLLSSCTRLYVLSVKEYPTMQAGEYAWVLDYSLDGEIYSAVFDTREELVRYYAWLYRGKIIRGGRVDEP